MENKPANQGNNSPEKRDEEFAPVSYQEEIKRKKPVSTIIIALLVLLGLVAAFFIFQLNSKNKKQEAELQKTYFQLDSISTQLDERILTISQLGGEIDTLLAIRQQLEEEKEQLRQREVNQTRQIRNLRDRVGGYQELLLQQDEEIAKLKVLNEQLLTENTSLKTEKNELNQTISTLNESKDELEQKVAAASQLRVEGMQVFAINKRGKEYETPFRSRQIDQIKVQFYISENQVAPIEGKDILLRIIATDGNVLFDVATGSGTFIFEGREMFYTAKQEILYDKTRKQVSFIYDKGSEYDPGVYKVEVYTDDYLMGRGQFTVK